MTLVEFHTGVADKLGFACRLLRKAFHRGVRVAVIGPDPDLAALDRALWAFEEREFIPHLRVAPATTAGLAMRTPIWLVSGPLPDGAPGVVVNLGAEPPDDLGAVNRLIEVVSADPDDEARGRARWRGYRARGLAVEHHPAGAARV
jgi:DNA polymerase-3 subunit chi